MNLLSYFMITVLATKTLLQPSVADERQGTAFARRRIQQWRHALADGSSSSGVLPRRQWRQPAATARAGSHVGEHVLASRQRHFLTSTMSPVRGHWRAIHDKLELQTMWPGTARYPDEAYLPATTVRTAVAVDSVIDFLYITLLIISLLYIE